MNGLRESGYTQLVAFCQSIQYLSSSSSQDRTFILKICFHHSLVTTKFQFNFLYSSNLSKLMFFVYVEACWVRSITNTERGRNSCNLQFQHPRLQVDDVIQLSNNRIHIYGCHISFEVGSKHTCCYAMVDFEEISNKYQVYLREKVNPFSIYIHLFISS